MGTTGNYYNWNTESPSHSSMDQESVRHIHSRAHLAITKISMNSCQGDNMELWQPEKLVEKPGTENQVLHGISTKEKPLKFISKKLKVK